MIDAFARSKKVRENGNVKIDEEIVWESFKLRIQKNSEDGGKPAA